MYILDFEARINNGKEVHWVHFAANGAEAASASTWMPVSHVKPREDKPGDPLIKERWEAFFAPAYESWMRGVKLPERGTPLSAWPALDQTKLKAFQAFRTL